MSYIEESLSNGERIHLIFKHHWIVQAMLIGHFLLALVTLGIWLPVAIYVWLKWRSTEQGVTNRRVIFKQGILSRKTDEMRLQSIEAIAITQSVTGRLFDFGSVTVTGRGAGDVTLRWMQDPMAVKREIENAENAQEASTAA